MRHYYTADAIRQAEAPLLASLPDGVLMRRAAHGLDEAQRFRPDVAFLDIGMPKLNGYDLATRIRGVPALVACPP